MNKGILQLALSGTVELELEYREPSGKELEAGQGLLGPAPEFSRDEHQAQLQEEFACLLPAI